MNDSYYMLDAYDDFYMLEASLDKTQNKWAVEKKKNDTCVLRHRGTNSLVTVKVTTASQAGKYGDDPIYKFISKDLNKAYNALVDEEEQIVKVLRTLDSGLTYQSRHS